MSDEDIIKIFFNDSKEIKIKHHTFKDINQNKDVIKYLNERFIEKSRTYKEDLIRIKLGIEIIPKCCICGNPCFFTGKPTNPYKIHCNCNKCVGIIRKEKADKTRIKHFGNKNYRNVEKAKRTNLERYGCEYTAQSEIMKKNSRKTKLRKYGNEKYVNTEKYKQTCLEKYGCVNTFQVEQFKNKIKETKFERYGDEHYLNRDKFKETCSYLYGGCGNASEIIKRKQQNTTYENYGTYCVLTLPEFRKFSKDACIKKYGTEYFAQSNEFKSRYEDEKYIKQIKKKEYETKKKNGTLGGPNSQMELRSYNFIKEVFPDVKRQYYDDLRYPWYCDLYIPSLDIFIECQYHPCHGGHPYDVNNNINNEKTMEMILNNKSIKGKTSEDKLKVFTITDVLKRNTAKENNLNYYEVFTEKEFKQLINELKEKYK